MSKNKSSKIKKTVSPVPGNAQPKKASQVISVNSILKGKELAVFLGVLSLIIIYVFKDFLFFKNVYLFKDIGSDTVNYNYPQLVHLSEYIRNLGMPAWSFNQGMGQNIYPFSISDPFTMLICLSGKENIPYMIVFAEVFKIIFAGCFFFLFLRKISDSAITAVVGGLLYSFGGYMILGSGWYVFSTEALYVAFLLYATELFLKQGIWYLLPLPFFLIGVLQPFYLYLYSLLVAVYCTLRIAGNKGWEWKEITVTLSKIAALALLGVLLSSAVLFSNVLQIMQSPRVAGDASFFKTLSSKPIFEVSPFVNNVTVLYRFFSDDLLGTGINFKGWSNYLEAPILYIGLLCLLLVPQVFSFLDKKKKIIYASLLFICFVPLVFPYFRYAFWLFSGDYYRSFSFFVSLLILFYSMKALSFIDARNTVNIKTLIVSSVVLLLLLYYPYFDKNMVSPVDKDLRNAIGRFLVVYTVLIYLLSKPRIKKYVALTLGIILCFELAYFSGITVNKRSVISKGELNQKVGFNDYTNEAVAYLNAKDNTFFRVVKDYSSGPAIHGSLNDAKIQNYKGTTNYTQFNQLNYVNFLNELKVIDAKEETATRWLPGLMGRPLLQTMASVKYTLSKQKGNGFGGVGNDSINLLGDVKVLRNKYYLPFGYSYKKYIPFSEFTKLSNFQKDKMLLNAVVVNDDEVSMVAGFSQLSSKDTIAGLTFDQYAGYINELKKDTFAISFYDQNNILGNINMDGKGLLFFSIPFDKGWEASVDGVSVELRMINIGFMGLLIDKGAHAVELHFRPPLVKEGTYVSCVAFLLYGFAFFRYRKRKF